jgi:hypothetical protein
MIDDSVLEIIILIYSYISLNIVLWPHHIGHISAHSLCDEAHTYTATPSLGHGTITEKIIVYNEVIIYAK